MDLPMWKKVYESNNPMKETFPLCDNNGTLEEFTMFQKLCILKVMRPDKLIPAAKEYVVQSKGE